jgi:hypothetical protein
MFKSMWQESYKAAVLETDQCKLDAHIEAAEEAIRARVALNDQISPEEQTAIQEATSRLRVLRLERKLDLSGRHFPVVL